MCRLLKSWLAWAKPPAFVYWYVVFCPDLDTTGWLAGLNASSLSFASDLFLRIWEMESERKSSCQKQLYVNLLQSWTLVIAFKQKRTGTLYTILNKYTFDTKKCLLVLIYFHCFLGRHKFSTIPFDNKYRISLTMQERLYRLYELICFYLWVLFYKNKTNHPILSNIRLSASANKAIDFPKWGGG